MNKWPITTQKETKHNGSPGKCKSKAQSDSTHTNSVPPVRKSESIVRDVKTWGCRGSSVVKTASPSDQSCIPSTWKLTTIHNSSSKRSDVFFWYLWTPDIHVVHRHTCKENAHTHEIKINTSLF